MKKFLEIENMAAKLKKKKRIQEKFKDKVHEIFQQMEQDGQTRQTRYKTI